MPSRTVESFWCLFRGSNNVRDTVKFMMNKKNVTSKAICNKLGIPPYRLSRYLNKVSANLNQYQLYQICHELDIEVNLNVEIRNI